MILPPRSLNKLEEKESGQQLNPKQTVNLYSEEYLLRKKSAQSILLNEEHPRTSNYSFVQCLKIKIPKKILPLSSKIREAY